MAGLYVIFGASDQSRLDAVAQYMRHGNEQERLEHGEFSYAWLSYDDPHYFAPAKDNESGVCVVTGGRLCWPTSVQQQSERLPYQGGLVNRVILDRYLNGGPDDVVPYNGAATILVWDPRSRCVHLWTDQFGYHPAFVFGSPPDKPTVFTTFPDAVLKDPAIEVTPDLVSMAEFLRAWRITPPHTYYEQLKHAGAASHWKWDLNSGEVSQSTYWRPFETEFFRNVHDAGEALAVALKSAVSERTAVAERIALFVSGGADSRVMLFGADDPSRATGINLYEEPTTESRLSKELCERAGAKYVGFGRDNDYYPRMLEENVRWSGGMWCTEDSHYLGVRHLVEDVDASLVMTACTTDWLFKGYGLEKSYHQFIGKNLPIKKFLEQRVNGFLPNYPRDSPSEFAQAIESRMNSWFAGCPDRLVSDRDHLLVEDRRIRPSCYTVSVSGQIMYRTYPYDTFLADSRVADCYSRIQAKWKLNGDVWGIAAARVCKDAADIVDANYGWKLNASTSSKLIAFAKGWLKRRLSRISPPAPDAAPANHPPSPASWPELGWYANHSPTLKTFWNSVSKENRERTAMLWGSDPWHEPLSEWSRKPQDLFRILTLIAHWQVTN